MRGVLVGVREYNGKKGFRVIVDRNTSKDKIKVINGVSYRGQDITEEQLINIISSGEIIFSNVKVVDGQLKGKTGDLGRFENGVNEPLVILDEIVNNRGTVLGYVAANSNGVAHKLELRKILEYCERISRQGGVPIQNGIYVRANGLKKAHIRCYPNGEYQKKVIKTKRPTDSIWKIKEGNRAVERVNVEYITVDKFKEFIRDKVKESGLNTPILAIGKPGIGKTRCIRDMASEEDIIVKEIKLKTIMDRGADSRRVIRELPNEEVDGHKGVLLITQITSVKTSDIVEMVGRLLRVRELGDYKLPKGWIIVLVGDDFKEKIAFSRLETSVINKLKSFIVETNTDVWIKWANGYGVNSDIISFLTCMPQYLYRYDGESKVLPNPKSWERLSEGMGNLSNGKLEGNKERSKYVSDIIGVEVAKEFLTFINRNERLIIDAKSIIEGRADKDISEIDKQTFIVTLQKLVSRLNKELNSGKIKGYRYNTEDIKKVANVCKWAIGVSRSSKGGANKILPVVSKHVKGFVDIIFLEDEFNRFCPEFQQFAVDYALDYGEG